MCLKFGIKTQHNYSLTNCMIFILSRADLNSLMMLTPYPWRRLLREDVLHHQSPCDRTSLSLFRLFKSLSPLRPFTISWTFYGKLTFRKPQFVYVYKMKCWRQQRNKRTLKEILNALIANTSCMLLNVVLACSILFLVSWDK